MDGPQMLSSDGWAALHLPAIEELLSQDEGPCGASNVFPAFVTGVRHSSAVFQTTLSTPAYSAGAFESPPLWTTFKDVAQDQSVDMWTSSLSKPIMGRDIPDTAVWQVPHVHMRQSEPLHAAFMEQDVAEQYVGEAEHMRRLVGHKGVPKKINIQEEFALDECEITTAMIRNVPNQLTRKQFVERLDQLGFRGLYDFVYVPMDRSTRMNVGYAFVNFIRPDIFRMCQSTLEGKSFLDKEDRTKRRGGKPIIVSPAHVQGLKDNERHFKDAAVSHTLHRPVKYVCSGDKESPSSILSGRCSPSRAQTSAPGGLSHPQGPTTCAALGLMTPGERH
ncbi:ML3 [Symbiodinium natans]|uniref:ML3 protein n=1 Tax=Symbiodinium natans TaxID=878477 RepID=A0A812R2J4_9DINO|nr:ML3 [Symbiodinium natans]